MKLTITAAFILLAAPALAIQQPSPGKNGDPHICDVPYDANNMVQINAAVGENVQIVFGKDERILDVFVSDKEHLKAAGREGSNTISIKAIADMLPKPITVRTLKSDAQKGDMPRDYLIQWAAIPPPPPTRVADATGETPPPAAATPCYIVRYTYASDVAAENAAKWAAQAAFRRQNSAEVALRQANDAMQCDTNHPFNPPGCNYAYVVVGDTRLSPVGAATGRPAVWDYKGTTVMRFPGNMALPIVLVVNRDGKEAQPSGVTVEDGGIVKLHSVEQIIRLRDGDMVLCIYNQRYNQIGDNPGTGTINDAISRTIKTRSAK